MPLGPICIHGQAGRDATSACQRAQGQRLFGLALPFR